VVWRSARTCLEYTFARDAFSLSAEAYSAESGAIDEFENSIWGIFCLTGTESGVLRWEVLGSNDFEIE
jgi:hypothetical protein